MGKQEIRIERMKTETARLKLKEQRIKLRTLEYTLKLAAQSKQKFIDERKNDSVVALQKVVNDIMLGIIDDLQNELRHANSEITKLRRRLKE